MKGEGIGVTVIDAYSIKPLGKKEILAAAQKTNNTVVTVEDHYSEGGLGDAVAGELSAEGIKVHKLAVNGIPRSGKAEELLAHFGIDLLGARQVAPERLFQHHARICAGQAGARQVPDAKLAVACGSGGILSCISTLILGKDQP